MGLGNTVGYNERPPLIRNTLNLEAENEPNFGLEIVWVFSLDLATNIQKSKSNVKCSSSPAPRERDTASVFLRVFHVPSY